MSDVGRFYILFSMMVVAACQGDGGGYGQDEEVAPGWHGGDCCGVAESGGGGVCECCGRD